MTNMAPSSIVRIRPLRLRRMTVRRTTGEPRVHRILPSIGWASAFPRSRFRRGLSGGGLGSQAFPGKVFDHTSVIKTVRNLFGVNANLGKREAAANSFESICSLSATRTDGDAIASMLGQPAPATLTAAVPAAAISETPDHATNSFSRIAMSLDLSMHAATPLPAVAVTHPTFAMDATHGQLLPHAVNAGRTKRQTLDYIQAVAARVERLKPTSAAAGAPAPPDNR